VVAFAAAARAGDADEASMEILRDTIQSNKKALVAVNLTLTDEEARSFWPIYDRYQADLSAVQDRLLRIIEDYAANFGSITDEKANQLVDDYHYTIFPNVTLNIHARGAWASRVFCSGGERRASGSAK